MINVDDLTVREVKELKALLGGESTKTVEVNPFSEFMGVNVFIRSVTHHYTGKVSKIVGSTACILESACWIADDGRFHDALKKSEFSEVEPYINPVMINFGAVLDITKIDKLPEVQK